MPGGVSLWHQSRSGSFAEGGLWNLAAVAQEGGQWIRSQEALSACEGFSIGHDLA
jgi:hypothetical protein